MRKISLTLAIILIISGCASVGPKQVHMDRGTYNSVVRETDQEQLLTNIVRQRYLEITEYIQVASLTASYSMTQSLAGNVTAQTSPGPAALTSSLSPTVSYSDTPTISYIPLSNVAFAKSLMSPVSMDNFLLLAHAGGYDHSMLYSIFFEQIAGYSSILLNDSGTNRVTDQFLTFNKIIGLLKKLYRSDAFEIPEAVVYDKHLGGILRFRNHRENSPDALKLKRLLGIPSHSKDIILMEHSLLETLQEKDGILVQIDPKSKPRNIVYVTFRSVYSIIYLVGRGVQVPCQDIKNHMTRELVNPNGSLYDWRQRFENIFTVYSSEQIPKIPTLVKVLVHNHWFYIKDSDQASKDTFDAIIRILTLTSAVASNNNSLPILTIPVASSSTK